jgi:hypothetical protein
MPESVLVTFRVNPALSPNDAVEIRVLSASGLDDDENLTLGVRRGFYFVDEGPWTESAIDPEESRALWKLLGDMEFHGVRGDEPVYIVEDGTLFSLGVRTGDLDVSPEWVQTPPEEWSGLAELVAELLLLAGPEGQRFRQDLLEAQRFRLDLRSSSIGSANVYAIGSSNDALIAGLHDPDPAERAENAEAIGTLHVYLALPHLLDTARSDPDPDVRRTAWQAVIALLDSHEATRRAIAGDAPAGGDLGRTLQKEQAAGVVGLFNEYAAARETRSPRPEEDDLIDPVTDYLGAWGGQSAQDLDELGLAAAMAVGAIVRFLDIPNEEAGTKSTSFRDAKERVAKYESMLAGQTA